ncbi:MAG: hypothetical protein ABSG15_04040 [FCB group bacterium]|jgi:hypothetical protein
MDYYLQKNPSEILNAIIKSADELVPLIVENKELDKVYHYTFSLILNFLKQVFELLPEMHIPECKYNSLKKEIINSVERAKLSMELFPESQDTFLSAWKDFQFYWNDYKVFLEKFDKSKNNFNISKN